jgi:hypothetical protein
VPAEEPAEKPAEEPTEEDATPEYAPPETALRRASAPKHLGDHGHSNSNYSDSPSACALTAPSARARHPRANHLLICTFIGHSGVLASGGSGTNCIAIDRHQLID